MPRKIEHFFFITFLLYLFATAVTFYLLLSSAPEVKETQRQSQADPNKALKTNYQGQRGKEQQKEDEYIQSPAGFGNGTAYEVWSKVGLGSYTWEHILGGQLEPRLGGIWHYGELQVGNFMFRMRDGDGVMPDRVPQDVENLLLILNGRDEERVQYTQTWLDYLQSFNQLKRVALMLIGNEQCRNDWVLRYMKSRGGWVDVLFIVYDTMIVNEDDILQWPLGVATYRGFPMIESSQLNLQASRRYRCNFLGTVYPGSSREQLVKIIQDHNLHNYCYLKTRQTWEPDETEASAQSYINILLQSDLTLSPVGKNAECYRIYEACALGSVPIVEDVTTEGDCSRDPFRLLKKLGAPFIFVKDWNELPKIMEEEMKMSVEEIVQRRRRLVAWYETFKDHVKDILLEKLHGIFEKNVHR